MKCPGAGAGEHEDKRTRITKSINKVSG